MKDKMEAIQRKHSKYSEGLGRQNGDKLVNMEIKRQIKRFTKEM